MMTNPNQQERIHQLQVSYSQVEDRLMLRINTLNKMEFRFWLTRRFVKRLWPGLRQSLITAPVIQSTGNPEKQKALLDFMHDAAVSQSNFSSEFQDEAQAIPLGPEPVLISKARLTPTGNETHLLSLHPEQGYGIELAMDANLLHSFCKLILDSLPQTDWDIELQLGSQKEHSPTIISDLSIRKEWKLN